MVTDYLDQQKFLLIEDVEKDIKKNGFVGSQMKDKIDFFYEWKDLGYQGALKEYAKRR